MFVSMALATGAPFDQRSSFSQSCRFRWVNKLRPNLKNGCKFTVEEEKIVIELQTQLGNKWATIATHLSGRTDNDVKNFWSSRQKRLARLLHSQSPPRKKHKVSSSAPSNPSNYQIPMDYAVEGEASTKAHSFDSSNNNSGTDANAMKMIPFPSSVESSYLFLEANNTLYYNPIPLNAYCSNMDFRFPFTPETQDVINTLDSEILSPFAYCTDQPALFDDRAHLIRILEEEAWVV